MTASQPPRDSSALQSADDRRTAPRLVVSASVLARGPRGAVVVMLQNISRVGAELTSADPVGEPGQLLELLLPSVHDEISVMAEVVRSQRTKTGHDVAVRFLDGGAKSTEALRELLDLLSGGAGGGTRAHPRLALRLPVRCRSAHHPEQAAQLEDVSHGGAAVVVDLHLDIGEALAIVIPDASGVECVLSGTVANQRVALPSGYRVGVKFGDDPTTRGNLDALLAYLLHR